MGASIRLLRNQNQRFARAQPIAEGDQQLNNLKKQKPVCGEHSTAKRLGSPSVTCGAADCRVKREQSIIVIPPPAFVF